jgi:hypothetical protein
MGGDLPARSGGIALLRGHEGTAVVHGTYSGEQSCSLAETSLFLLVLRENRRSDLLRGLLPLERLRYRERAPGFLEREAGRSAAAQAAQREAPNCAAPSIISDAPA